MLHQHKKYGFVWLLTFMSMAECCSRDNNKLDKQFLLPTPKLSTVHGSKDFPPKQSPDRFSFTRRKGKKKAAVLIQTYQIRTIQKTLDENPSGFAPGTFLESFSGLLSNGKPYQAIRCKYQKESIYLTSRILDSSSDELFIETDSAKSSFVRVKNWHKKVHIGK